MASTVADSFLAYVPTELFDDDAPGAANSIFRLFMPAPLIIMLNPDAAEAFADPLIATVVSPTEVLIFNPVV